MSSEPRGRHLCVVPASVADGTGVPPEHAIRVFTLTAGLSEGRTAGVTLTLEGADPERPALEALEYWFEHALADAYPDETPQVEREFYWLREES